MTGNQWNSWSLDHYDLWHRLSISNFEVVAPTMIALNLLETNSGASAIVGVTDLKIALIETWYKTGVTFTPSIQFEKITCNWEDKMNKIEYSLLE